jgi:GTP-binding protein LepA
MDNQTQIRNFCIISHIDHGKSTLADRFLELCNVVEERKMQSQYLDMMDLERERGITIKLQPCRMNYDFEGKNYILNLIDTPGHVDFGYEVSRSLAAVEGAILLVDASKGIQAQTLANLNLAKEQNLVIIPVVNKIDLPHAQTEQAIKDLAKLLEIQEDEIIKISAKLGTNIEQVLQAVIKKVPLPKGDLEKPLRALIFDSKYDSYKGVIAYVRIIDGKISKEQKIYLIKSDRQSEVKEVGYFKPEFFEQKELISGEIGYIATGIKEIEKVRVGDTITNNKLLVINKSVQSLYGYEEPKPMIFASIYPENPDDYDILKNGLEKLKLSDASLSFDMEAKMALGRGFRCGFLGMLHTEIVIERLRREFSLKLIVSTPTVIYRIIDKRGKVFSTHSASDWLDSSQIQEIQEPWIKLEIIIPNSYLGSAMKLFETLNGKYIETKYLGSNSMVLVYEAALREIIVNFYDKLKRATEGYGSMNYEILEYRKGDLVKLDVLVLGEKQEALSQIVSNSSAFKDGSRLVKKLKDVFPPQQFSVPLQAAIEGRIIARETVSARRKDVTAGLYGGDYSRKRKQLEKQKKGKKALKEKAKTKIPAEVYLKIFT